MTIPEVCRISTIETITLVIKINIFVLDMGSTSKIVDLAKKFINLSGLDVRDQDNPSGDIEIKFIGLRPGEKLYEELFSDDNYNKTSHENIFEANEEKIQLDIINKL